MFPSEISWHLIWLVDLIIWAASTASHQQEDREVIGFSAHTMQKGAWSVEVIWDLAEYMQKALEEEVWISKSRTCRVHLKHKGQGMHKRLEERNCLV